RGIVAGHWQIAAAHHHERAERDQPDDQQERDRLAENRETRTVVHCCGPISLAAAGVCDSPAGVAWIPWLARNSASATCSSALRSFSFSWTASMSTMSRATRALPAACSYRLARISSTVFVVSPRSPTLNATLESAAAASAWAS